MKDPERKPPPMTPVSARACGNPWARYEQLKRELPKTLTPEEYTRACQALAKRCGI